MSLMALDPNSHDLKGMDAFTKLSSSSCITRE
ncbi:hypothetical protein M2281_003835 [Mesorhizobium soli]|nr:hypothetical protein [Mesorhizobium soli]